jgi:hypothetical protein
MASTQIYILNTMSNASTSSATAGTTSFPFLKLPAELRNHVYALVLAALPKLVALRRPDASANVRGSNYFALGSASKQLRIEFWPLLLGTAKLQPRLCDFPGFIDTFYRPDAGGLRPLHVRVNVDVESCFTWDMRPLMLAKTTTRGLHLEFRLVSEDEKALKLQSQLSEALGPASRSMLQRVRNGSISQIQFKWNRFGTHRWAITVRKKCGGLQKVEVGRFRDYCRLLRIRTSVFWLGQVAQEKVFVNIHVVDFDGKRVENWLFRDKRLRKKKPRTRKGKRSA